MTSWQIFSSGVVLETISPDGVVFKLFPRGDSFFYVKSMYVGPKSSEPIASLVSLNKSSTSMAIPVTKSPLKMATHAAFGNRQSNWRVP